MQIPKRRSQTMRQLLQDQDDQTLYLTPEGIARMRRTLEDLEHQRPAIVEELSRAIQMGDLSENAEYTDAKARLARTDGRIFSIKERLKKAVRIDVGATADGRIQLGSTVTVSTDRALKTYVLVGPQETNPTQGRISFQSPLGTALMGHTEGDVVDVETPQGKLSYTIVEVR